VCEEREREREREMNEQKMTMRKKKAGEISRTNERFVDKEDNTKQYSSKFV
jgi:hypothetical protein